MSKKSKSRPDLTDAEDEAVHRDGLVGLLNMALTRASIMLALLDQDPRYHAGGMRLLLTDCMSEIRDVIHGLSRLGHDQEPRRRGA